jgi:hypothetical protein
MFRQATKYSQYPWQRQASMRISTRFVGSRSFEVLKWHFGTLRPPSARVDCMHDHSGDVPGFGQMCSKRWVFPPIRRCSATLIGEGYRGRRRSDKMPHASPEPPGAPQCGDAHAREHSSQIWHAECFGRRFGRSRWKSAADI